MLKKLLYSHESMKNTFIFKFKIYKIISLFKFDKSLKNYQDLKLIILIVRKVLFQKQ